MKQVVASFLLFTGLAAAALPAGATTYGSVSQPRTSWMSFEARSAKALLYVGNSFTATVSIFAIAGTRYKQVGQITGFNAPAGLRTDKAGNLYVVDTGVKNEGGTGGTAIYVFPPGSTSPSRSIFPQTWDPWDVAVGNDGSLYVANIAPDDAFNPGSVSVYPPGSSAPSAVLQDSRFFQVLGVVVDRRNNLYVSYESTGNSGGDIALFKHARGQAKELGISGAIGFPWGIAEDRSGRLLVCDGGNAAIDAFSKSGQPLGSIAVPGAPQFATLSTHEKRIYATAFNGTVEIFNYPSGEIVGSIAQWSPAAWPTGIAYWPPDL